MRFLTYSGWFSDKVYYYKKAVKKIETIYYTNRSDNQPDEYDNRELEQIKQFVTSVIVNSEEILNELEKFKKEEGK